MEVERNMRARRRMLAKTTVIKERTKHIHMRLGASMRAMRRARRGPGRCHFALVRFYAHRATGLRTHVGKDLTG